MYKPIHRQSDSLFMYKVRKMDILTGPSKNSWQPVMTADTTTSSYWLNWRVLICTIWILMSLVFSSFLISKYEGHKNSRNRSRENPDEEPAGLIYDDEIWRPCLRGIHPAWLLGYRVFAFIVLLILLILNVVADGAGLFYYYTQWTFTLITIYFGIGSLLSFYGCHQYQQQVGGDKIASDERDTEQGTSNTAGITSVSSTVKSSGPNEVRKIADFWGYGFQIIFQMNAGAVILTDCVFWFIIVPFLAIKDYNLNFLIINMHTINVILMLGDTALNSLRFPWFRIAYFFVWTSVYVIFQWIVHACISLWWAYPFLDLSSPFSPLWYSAVALLHIPCYGVFALIMKMKHALLSKYFPESYQCRR